MSRGRGVTRNGRSKGQLPPFQPVIHEMADSIAWRSLSGPAVKVFIDLRRRFNGFNNGQIYYGMGSAAERLFLGKATVKRALAELMANGFLRQTGRGGWLGRQAATYAVTDKPHGNNLPTNEWRDWRPASGNVVVLKRHPKSPCGAGAKPQDKIPPVRVSCQHPSERENAS